MAVLKWAIIAMQAVVAVLLISDVGPVFGLLIWGYSFATGILLAKFWVIPFFGPHRLSTLRASDGGGE